MIARLPLRQLEMIRVVTTSTSCSVGVLIFLRFYYIVGNAGIWQTYIVVLVSFACAFITTMSLSAVATNGPIEEGGT